MSAQMADSRVVVDTSVLYAVAAPYEIDEIKALAPAEIVVPFAAVSELDQLMQRPRERDRARSALNVLKSLVSRGAVQGPVTCGSGLTFRFATAQEEQAPSDLDGLDGSLADDRILACAIKLGRPNEPAVLATTEFALYVKSELCGVRGLYLDRFADAHTIVGRRERVSFEAAWNRLQSGQDIWAVCRRALTFLRSPLVQRLLRDVRRDRSPGPLFAVLTKFDALSTQWTEGTVLNSVLFTTIGLVPAPQVNYSVAIINEPGRVYPYAPASNRNETPDERALLIKSEEAAARGRDEFNVDVVLAWMESVREYVLEQVGEET